MTVIKHVLFFKLRKDKPTELAALTTGFYSLRSLPGVIDLYFGPHLPSEQLHSGYNDRSNGYTHVLDVSFTSGEALQSYTVNEQHVVVRDQARALLQPEAAEPRVVCIDAALESKGELKRTTDLSAVSTPTPVAVASTNTDGNGNGECGRRRHCGGRGDRCRHPRWLKYAGYVAAGIAIGTLLSWRRGCHRRTTGGPWRPLPANASGGCPVNHGQSVAAPAAAPAAPAPAAVKA